ncbi:MAG: DapH/DapD/GlmU-related protein [Candidatus Promineifilaceae bacterium]
MTTTAIKPETSGKSINWKGLPGNLVAMARAKWFLRGATSVGHKVRMWGRHALVRNYGTLCVADRVRLFSFITPLDIMIGQNGTMEIGENTFINYGVSMTAIEKVTIGRNCSIGTYVMIIDNDFHSLSPEHRDIQPPSKPITIGNNVWLGGHVIVLPGVTIGDGSVIGAGSVVTGNIPPRSLAVGTPAKVIRTL